MEALIERTSPMTSKTSYINTTICEDWLCFDKFEQWYIKNYPNHIVGIKLSLDKDLLQQGIENKIYSPETCVFLPHSINTFLAINKPKNTSGYVGVSWYKNRNKWVSQIHIFNEKTYKNLGYFKDIEEASLVYQKARAEQAEKAKQYLRNLNYLPEEIIQLVK